MRVFVCGKCGHRTASDTLASGLPCTQAGCRGHLFAQPTATEGQDIPAQLPIENTELLDTGIKFDSAKTRYDLVSPEWEEGLAKVMTHGATKYAARNWENGILISRCYAGLRRHVAAFMRGEDIDPDSGLPHLFHANANLQFLWAMPSIHPEMDDRQAVAICSVQKLNVATPTDQESE